MGITLTKDQEKVLREVMIYIRLCKKAYAENNQVFKEAWAQQNFEKNTIMRIKDILGIQIDNKEEDEKLWAEVNARLEKLKGDTNAKDLKTQREGIANDLQALFPLSRKEAASFGKYVLAAGAGFLLAKGVIKLFTWGSNKKDTGK